MSRVGFGKGAIIGDRVVAMFIVWIRVWWSKDIRELSLHFYNCIKVTKAHQCIIYVFYFFLIFHHL